MAKRSSRTGTPNSKNYSNGSGRITQTRSPWGTPGVSKSSKGTRGKVSGSSTRQATPDSAQRGMTYPANQPSQWPIQPDMVGHTKPPKLSGLTNAIITKLNATVERAYTRAKYQ